VGWNGAGWGRVARVRCWVLRDREPSPVAGRVAGGGVSCGAMIAGVGRGGGFRPYVENYTVDASIFELKNCSGHTRLDPVGFGCGVGGCCSELM